MSTDQYRGGSAWGGWLVFAAIVMGTVGFVNAIQGFTALLKDEVYLVTESGLLVTADFTAWGWTLIIWGVLMILVAAGLMGARGWARWVAVAVIVVNLIIQFAWFPAYPLWSLVTIGLNMTVLYALTARWDEAQTSIGD
jgi:hypothetical protein